MIPMENNEASFWQSRMSVAGKPARFPKLTDIRALARHVRMAYSAGRLAPTRILTAAPIQLSSQETVVLAVLQHPPGAIL